MIPPKSPNETPPVPDAPSTLPAGNRGLTNRNIFVVGKKGFGKTWYIINRILIPAKKPYIVIDPLKEYPVKARFEDVDTFLAAAARGLPRSVGLTLPFQDDVFEVFAFCWHLTPHILVIEEFHLYASVHSVAPALQRIFRMGRHRQIDIVGVSHRIGDLPQIALTQVDNIVMFRQQGPRDLKAIERTFDASTATTVSALPPREFVSLEL